MSALCLRTGGLLTRGLLIRTTGVLGGEGGSLGGERGWFLSLFENISDLKFWNFRRGVVHFQAHQGPSLSTGKVNAAFVVILMMNRSLFG